MATEDVDKFLQSLYESHEDPNDIDRRVFDLLKFLDKILSRDDAGRTYGKDPTVTSPDIEHLLVTCDVEKLSPVEMLGIISYTYPAKGFLCNREAFVTRATARMVQCIGAERTESLIANRR